MQKSAFEAPYRKNERDVSLGLLPQSHSFSLIIICHEGVYRGDGVVILPGFDLHQLLRAIQDFKMTRLYVVRALISNDLVEHKSNVGIIYRFRQWLLPW